MTDRPILFCETCGKKLRQSYPTWINDGFDISSGSPKWKRTRTATCPLYKVLDQWPAAYDYAEGMITNNHTKATWHETTTTQPD